MKFDTLHKNERFSLGFFDGPKGAKKMGKALAYLGKMRYNRDV